MVMTRFRVEVRVVHPGPDAFERWVVTDKGPLTAGAMGAVDVHKEGPERRTERVLVWPAEDQTVRDTDIIHSCLCNREPE